MFKANSNSTLQYLNKTFGEFKTKDGRYSGHLKPAANILKYKKYIKPLASWKKLVKRATSPISLHTKTKWSKSTKASTDVHRKAKKDYSIERTRQVNTESTDFMTKAAHNTSTSITSINNYVNSECKAKEK